LVDFENEAVKTSDFLSMFIVAKIFHDNDIIKISNEKIHNLKEIFLSD